MREKICKVTGRPQNPDRTRDINGNALEPRLWGNDLYCDCTAEERDAFIKQCCDEVQRMTGFNMLGGIAEQAKNK